MKTKDLIKLLQEEDPSGEEEVTVGNADISYVMKEPCYYDGCQQILIRDERGYIIGAKRRSQGIKITINPMSIADVLFDRPNLPIDYSDLEESRAQRYKDGDDKIRKEVKEYEIQSELKYFLTWITKKAKEIYDDLDDLELIAKEFFLNNLSPKDKFPEDGTIIGMSYITRREEQWNRQIKIYYNGNGKWEISK